MKTFNILRQLTAILTFAFIIGSTCTSCQRGYGCPGDITKAPVEQQMDQICFEDLNPGA